MRNNWTVTHLDNLLPTEESVWTLPRDKSAHKQKWTISPGHPLSAQENQHNLGKAALCSWSRWPLKVILKNSAIKSATILPQDSIVGKARRGRQWWAAPHLPGSFRHRAIRLPGTRAESQPAWVPALSPLLSSEWACLSALKCLTYTSAKSSAQAIGWHKYWPNTTCQELVASPPRIKQLSIHLVILVFLFCLNYLFCWRRGEREEGRRSEGRGRERRGEYIFWYSVVTSYIRGNLSF